ncbi:MAG: hypothetical protein KGK11_10470 [Sphingomonadales bacterium]|nr:hypothetical protein [Sphingomonadales bacterium]
MLDPAEEIVGSLVERAAQQRIACRQKRRIPSIQIEKLTLHNRKRKGARE